MQNYLIAGSFIIEPLRETLLFWIHEAKLNCKVRFAPYNQLFQSLLAKESVQETAILLIRASDLSGNAELFLNYIKEALNLGTPEIIVLLCPEIGAKKELNQRDLNSIPGAYCLEVEEWIDRYRVHEVHAADADASAHIPYSEAFYALLGTLIARLIYLDARPLLKLIAVDADNTLWKGVAAEGSVTPYREFQRWLGTLQSSGIAVAVLSKNNKDDVLEVFNSHPEMDLRKEQVTAWYVDWEKKEKHLSDLIAKLNIAPHSVLFIDDNPVECAAVENALPETVVLQFQQDLFWHVWDVPLFPRSNEEDKNRTLLFQQHLKREECRAASKSLQQFFSELNLEVRIEKANPSEYERIAQLTQRTNQFNSCRRPLKYSQVAEYSGTLFAVHVKDRFGDYGLVGVIFVKNTVPIPIVEQFLLSCRVLGRGIEHQIVQVLGGWTQGKELFFSFKETARNLPIKQFLESLKPKKTTEEGYLFTSEALLKSCFMPDHPLPAAPFAQKIEPKQDKMMEKTAFLKITRSLTTIEAIQRRLRKPSLGPVHTESNPLTSLIITSMEEALNRVGIDNSSHFFSLGGDSFAAASLAAKLKTATGTAVDILHVFDHPTAQELTELILNLPQTSEEAYPATEEQIALWHGLCSATDPSLYLIKLSFLLEGSLDPTKLDACIRILRKRHTALSCDILLPNGLFSSIEGFLYTLEQQRENEWIFHIQFHHLISDEQSITLFMTELTTLYNEARPHLKQVSSYREYAIKQNHAIPTKTLDFWKGEKSEQTKAARPYSNAGHFRVPFPSLLLEAALKKCKELETTPFILLLTAFTTAFQKIEQQECFCIGIPFTTRCEETGFGLFVNTLPLQFTFNRDLSFNEQIQQCKSKVNALYAHRHTPFIRIREALNLTNQIDALFTWNRRIGQTPTFHSLQTTRLEQLPCSCAFALNLIVEEETDSWTLHYQYATTAYEEQIIQALHTHMLNWLQQELQELPAPSYSPPPLLQDIRGTWMDLFTAVDPEKIALDGNQRSLTYGALNAIANKLAQALRKIGISKNCGVAICMHDPLEQLVATVAVLKTGGYFIPLDYSTPLPYRQELLNLAQPKLLLEKLDHDLLQEQPADNPEVSFGEEDTAYQLFTSGSTGKPKSVKIDHKGLIHRMVVGAPLFHIDKESRVLCQASPSFDMHIAEWGMALSHGATLCPFKGSPTELIRFIQSKKVSHALFTPSFLNAFNPNEFSSLQFLMLAGESTPQKLLERWQEHCVLFNGYGPAECTIFTHLHRLQKGQNSRHLGAPIPGVRCSVLDDRGAPVPEGAIGELCVEGIGVSEECYKTQDLVRLLPQGEHLYVGRKCDLLKIHGCRVDPFLITDKVLSVPDIREALVLPYNDTGLICYFTATKDLSDAIRTHLRATLPSYMIPAFYQHLNAIPLLPSGKIDRSSLSPPYVQQIERPFASYELKLKEIWEQLLKRSIDFPTADFFQQGGDSLTAVHLILAVEKRWGAPLRFHDLLKHSTLEELADWIERHQKTSNINCLLPLRIEGRHPPLILFHPSDGLAECYRRLLTYIPDYPLYGVEKRPSFNLSDHPAEMAAFYVRSILQAFHETPCILGGWSLGGQIALEAARLLEKEGQQILQVLLIDSFAPVEPHPIPYAGPVHLIRSSSSPKPMNGWDSLSRLTMTELHMKHEEMFNDDNIATLAMAFREAIQPV